MSTFKHNKTALITGANKGIGLELTRCLLQEGWNIIALNRSLYNNDNEQINRSLEQGSLRVYQADLSDFDSLKAALQQIKASENKIDVLFNNAGGSFPELILTKQGREKHFDVQIVAPYIILMELKELLGKGSMRTVVNTSSSIIKTVRHFDPAHLAHPPQFKRLFGPYATTKLALSLWTEELAGQLAHEGFRLLSVDPGGNNTLRKDKDSGLPIYMKMIMKLFFPHPGRGASLLYDAAFSSTRSVPSGSFLIKGKAASLKFTEQRRAVLDMVHDIYQEAFIGN
ncbi:SDR family oxidoreductase [Paenibacillus sp. JX-17]|uniref:SDR family oxidoreductase n=1 Tax=Paenibacillus lacisoli TaxID=3064525 RepID=A0ABT9CCG5_9BACL|nr:SDR family oxidoreductase [Paenibacillus sp. JX-17]MDO7906263.1 SDR family oxidoreductase [Paenibacillus sp. JX-17]